MERTYKTTSDDIRKRFCESVDNGTSRKEAARIMGVAEYTGRRVLDRYFEEGDTNKSLRGGKKPKM